MYIKDCDISISCFVEIMHNIDRWSCPIDLIDIYEDYLSNIKIKNHIKKTNYQNVLKFIPTIIDQFRLRPDTLPTKIIGYNNLLKNDSHENLYNIIKQKEITDNEFTLKYLDIRSHNEINNITKYYDFYFGQKN